MRDPDKLPRTGLSCRAAAAGTLVVCAVCALSLAPFLRLFEFSNGGENAVVASVQEIHRGGPWLVPTLHEEQRTKKPPLATWLSALAAHKETTARLSDPDSATRHEAFRDFGWQVRWPALAAMCGVLLATYILGAMLGGPRLGLLAAVVCGTNFFWLKNARLATTDAHLALWVSVANCLLAAAVLRRQLWLGLVGGGAALGLAMMSKGPVALLQTALPVLAFAAWQRWRWRGPDEVPPDAPRGRVRWPLVVGVLVFAAVGLSWYGLVFWKSPAVWEEWTIELTREGATSLEPSRWYNYVLLIANVFPWGFFLVVGLIGSITIAVTGRAEDTRADDTRAADTCAGELAAGKNARAGRIVLAVFLLLVPIVVMSFFRDRKLRYLIPLITPSSILVAWGVLGLLCGSVRRRGTAWLVAGFHWLPLLVAGVGLPLAGSPLFSVERMGEEPWYSLRFAVIAAGAFALLVAGALFVQRRRPVWAVAAGTLGVMVAWNVVLNLGYRHTREGGSELKALADQILAVHPDAQVYSYRADRPSRHAPIDLSIYLNRVVEALADPAELAATSGPRVYVVRQKHVETLDDPAPLAPSAGGPWRFFAAIRVDDSTWYAFTSAP